MTMFADNWKTETCANGYIGVDILVILLVNGMYNDVDGRRLSIFDVNFFLWNGYPSRFNNQQYLLNIKEFYLLL